MSIKRILVPTDFSEYANHATEVAASIAKKTGARVFLLHIVDIPTYEKWNNRQFQDVAEGLHILRMVKKKFSTLLSKSYLKDVNVGEVLQFGNTFENISTQASKHKIDLIVMGSHGLSGWREDMVGSNTEKVIRFADCPVLTIKRKYKNFSFKNMVFASDFIGTSTQAFNKIKNIADLFSSKIELLKIITPNNFETTTISTKSMDDFARKAKIKNYNVNVFNAGSIESGVQEFCKVNKSDLIAIETHGRRGIAHFIQGSIAEDIANHIKLPVLSIKIKEMPVRYGLVLPQHR